MLDVGIVGKPNAVSHGGHYDDVYEKTDVGWRFKKRTYWESKVDFGRKERPPKADRGNVPADTLTVAVSSSWV